MGRAEAGARSKHPRSKHHAKFVNALLAMAATAPCCVTPSIDFKICSQIINLKN
jgi:hypothetical protein